jgi:TPR repeat protein
MDSQYNIALFYKDGEEVVKQDLKKAVHWFKLAALKGDIGARRELGYCYFHGKGVKINYLKAIYFYRLAASKNDPMAFYNLGLCYKAGDGVIYSKRWAKYYFEKAVARGHKAAKVQLKDSKKLDK